MIPGIRDVALPLLFALLSALAANAQPAVPEGGIPVWRRTDDGGSSESSGGSKIFSVPAFFVVFRETVEAVVIISVMLRLLDKCARPELKKYVWWGSFVGLVLASIIAVGFILAFYVFQKNAFSGSSEAIFEGCLMVAACIIITYLAASMLRMSEIRAKWERKLAAQVQRVEAQQHHDGGAGGDAVPEKKAAPVGKGGIGAKSMFWVPFAAVLREGVETVVFLGGVQAGYPTSSIPLPAVCGIVCGIAVGWFIFRAGNEGTLRTFLAWSTALLLFISAGLLSRGFRSWTTAGWFGPPPSQTGSSLTVDGEPVPWQNHPVWNICSCCSTSNEFFSLMAALFGYSCAPTPIQLMAWCMYWPMAGTFMCYKLRAFCFREVPKMNEPAEGEGVATMSQLVRAVNADGSDIDDTLSDNSIESPKDIEEGKEPSTYEGAFDGAAPAALAPKASITA